ncbi:hypothetical protein SARC_08734 [Sphaeroforma arctica JP610]|uniref:Uncharacterized protein n=1 Tax=Sphaeroforma arctica JP610 TaxID=667725 RepID=A0A0L0FPW4_9EUKA|nr:hypothetical protein SARC_08734 [Sphaeroforma arctica JP610]KNC78850.1 hypothetical protein SARC_08734 [Sphaeroforma arctica JP610]|eukprot:XP_014152752.1 hypothetical protein SARC_08734 [Sphaeroforma arctica JP610]
MQPFRNTLELLIMISIARLACGAPASYAAKVPEVNIVQNQSRIQYHSLMTRQSRCKINQVRNDSGECECAVDYPIWNELKDYCVDDCPSGSILRNSECRCKDLDQVWSDAEFACIDHSIDIVTDTSDGEDEFEELESNTSSTTCGEEYISSDCDNRSDFETRKSCCVAEGCEEFDECSAELCCGVWVRPATAAMSFVSESMDGDSLLRCEAVIDETTCKEDGMVLLKRQRCCFDDTCDAQLEVCSAEVCCGDD